MGLAVIKDLPCDLQIFRDEFVRDCYLSREIATLPYQDFIEMVKDLNRLFQQTEDVNGKSLFFLVKGGSDESMFWRATVRISCIRIVKSTKKVEGYKLLTLKDFIEAYRMITQRLKPMIESRSAGADSCEASSGLTELRRHPISASMFLNEIGDKGIATDLEECCICMERRPEVTLPCAHSYCLFCIEQWNVSNKTCPVCRETIENTDDSWVLPDIPDSTEVSEEVSKIVSEFTSQFRDKT